MKRKLMYFSILLLMMIGCAENSSFEMSSEFPKNEEERDHNVSLSAIKNLIDINVLTRTCEDSSSSIICVKGEFNDTLLYLCDNEDGGWTIYSSDTRVPPIVARSDKGNINEALKNELRKYWINSLAEQMQAIRQSKDEELAFSASEIETHKKFWNSISKPDEYVKTIARKPDSLEIKPINPYYPFWEDCGHYEIVSSDYTEDIIDQVPMLTETSWHQGAPYNKYCPDVIANVKGAAGCVAIAGAQMLYYLHYKLGVPKRAPSQANVSGVYPYHQWSQYNYTEDIWDKMNQDGQYASPLIADIGRRVGMDYTFDVIENMIYPKSGAITENLVRNVFLPYGVECQYSEYDEKIVEDNLLSGIPVLVCANGEYYNGESAGGHAFICDKYKKSRKMYTITYRWVYDKWPTTDDGKLIPVPKVPDKTEIVYESDYHPMVGMNWGWGNISKENDEWYSAIGSWIEKANKIDWKYRRHLIHSFSIAAED